MTKPTDRADARAPAPPPKRICSLCEWFTPPGPVPVAAANYGINSDLGQCDRFPQIVRKKASERCGEFRPRQEEVKP